jgi:hypothetical protein
MTTGRLSLQAKRQWCLDYGVQHREHLMQIYMDRKGLTKRPMVNDVIDEMIEEIQGASLRSEALPLDRFAQTQNRKGRTIVTISNRIHQIPGVIDVDGVATVAKHHESIHVGRDMHPGALAAPWQVLRRGVGHSPVDEGTVVCRAQRLGQTTEERDREFIAELAGLASSIAGADLERCPLWREFQSIAADGRELKPHTIGLLRKTAAYIGVNRSALRKYLELRGLLRVEVRDGVRRVVIAPQHLGGFRWVQLG